MGAAEVVAGGCDASTVVAGAGTVDWLTGCALAGVAAVDLSVAALARSGVSEKRVTPVARRGNPADVLVREALGSDFLVVGAGQSTAHHYRVLGPTAQGCVTRSTVPVVVVP